MALINTVDPTVDPAEEVERAICEAMHKSWMEAYNRKEELLKKDYSKSTTEEILGSIAEIIDCDHYMKDFGLSNLFYNSTLG